jgi:hypothetical protein
VLLRVDFDLRDWRVEDVPAVVALKVEDTPVTLDNSVTSKTRLREMVVDIVREDEVILELGLSQSAEMIVSIVRICLSIQVKVMTIEKPKLLRILSEESWVGGVVK